MKESELFHNLLLAAQAALEARIAVEGEAMGDDSGLLVRLFDLGREGGLTDKELAQVLIRPIRTQLCPSLASS